MVVYVVLAAVLIGLDQLIKAWVIAHLSVAQGLVVVPGVLSLTHLQNRGAAFSILEGQQWVFYIVTVVALGVVIALWRDSRGHVTYRLGLTLVVAGALGNFVDRLRLQYVTDMFQLDFMNFAIFNFADVCLTLGVFFIIIHLLFLDQKGRRA